MGTWDVLKRKGIEKGRKPTRVDGIGRHIGLGTRENRGSVGKQWLQSERRVWMRVGKFQIAREEQTGFRRERNGKREGN